MGLECVSQRGGHGQGQVEHPTLPVDPLFYEDITLHELVGEIKVQGLFGCGLATADLFVRICDGSWGLPATSLDL